MYKKIEGIIISEYPIEESSKIINIFTNTYKIVNYYCIIKCITYYNLIEVFSILLTTSFFLFFKF